MSFLRTAHPFVLLLLAIAIVVGSVLGAGRGMVHRLLWSGAAVVAVLGAVEEWRR